MKKRNKLVGLLMAACAMAAGSATAASAAENEGKLVQEASETDTASEKDPEAGTDDAALGEGQRKADIQVISIIGNELTYFELAETGTEEIPEKSETEAGTAQMPEKSETEAGTAEIPEKSETEAGTAQMPEKTETGAAAAGPEDENGGIPDHGSFEPGQMNDERPDMSNSDQGREDRKRGERRETKTTYIPVAALVHTDTGEEMTFSILEAGDTLEVLFEEDDTGEEIITEIWMKSAEEENG